MLRRSPAAEQNGLRASTKRSVRTMLSAEQFRWAIERESQRVDRLNAGELSLVLFRVTPGARRRTNVRLARAILSRVRVTDDVGWFDRDHVGLLLPETSSAGAWTLAQAICEIMARHGSRPLCSMYNYPSGGENAQAAPITRTDPPEVLKAAS